MPTEAVGKSAMRKSLWRIIPLIMLCYLCAYIDRTNVGFAAVQMNVDLKFSATIYGLGAGLFFLGYALFEIPSNLMAVRYGSRRWLARIMITWGLLSAAMMLVRTPGQFYAMRFLLGMAEAGFFPGVILYFSRWFPASHRSRAVARFYVAVPLASLVTGSLAAWLLGLDGVAGLRGWHWLFLVQGLPTVAVGLLVLAALPDRPATVSWLTLEEKAWIARELACEAALIGEPARHDLIAAMSNPRVLLLGVTGFLIIAVTTTLVLSAPSVLITLTGLGTAHVGRLVALGGVIGAVTVWGAGDYADRRGDRFLNSFWLLIAMAAGSIGMAVTTSPLLIMGAYLVFAISCVTVCALTASGWAELLHVRELAVGSAAVNTMANLGGFALPFAWGAARDATGGFTIGLLALAALSFIASVLCLRIRAGVMKRRTVAAMAM